MKYTEKEVAQILKDYRWMLNTIKEMQDVLKDADGAPISQYGIDAVMPKAQGQTSDVVYGEVLRRSKQWKRIEMYEERIRFVQKNLHKITDDREAEVLHWLLEGKSNRWIAQHMELSYTYIYKVIDSIVKNMVN